MPELDVTTKICNTCKIAKPISEFYASVIKIGAGHCKQCHRIYQRKYYDEVWYPKHRAKLMDKGKIRNNSQEHRDYNNARNKRPDVLMKRRARITLIHAIERGEVTRPDSCEMCGKKCKPHAHHHKGYEGKNVFDVQWLCHVCHKFIHRLKPEETQSGS